MMSLEMKSPKLSMAQRLGKVNNSNNTIKHTHNKQLLLSYIILLLSFIIRVMAS